MKNRIAYSTQSRGIPQHHGELRLVIEEPVRKGLLELRRSLPRG